MKMWDVTARAMSRADGQPIGSPIGRTERVNTNNPLFAKCRSAQDVHEAYEAFWNERNPRSAEVVTVIAVRPV